MKKLLILGGGTAGWMAANMLNHHLDKSKQWQITLVESPQIGIIGVGEGSTPQLKTFFDSLGIHESEWMPACSATYKNGISFIDWSEGTHSQHYFHPFPSPFDRQTASVFLYHCQMRARGMDVPVNPQDFFLSAKLAELNMSPKPLKGKPQTPLNYAYHFDSAKLGEFLCKHAVEQGVIHVKGTMSGSDKTSLKNSAEKQLKSITLQNGDTLEADMFIDATGFNSLLLQGVMQVPFESFENNLFNNRAVAIPTNQQATIASDTKATALNAGWAWQIPLIGRTGNGYVYSDKYISPKQAEAELRTHLALKHNTTISGNELPESQGEARHLSMKVGQVREHWHANVVAVGLSQGFIEPLEATALHLVYETIAKLAASILDPMFETEKPRLQAEFNDAIRKRFNGVRDYIVCHYKMNTRSDSGYWRDNRENDNISPQLGEVIDTWHSGKDITPVLTQYEMTRYYPVVSWYCLLAGYGAFKPATSTNKLPSRNMTQLTQYIMRSTQSFASHNDALNLKA